VGWKIEVVYSWVGMGGLWMVGKKMAERLRVGSKLAGIEIPK